MGLETNLDKTKTMVCTFTWGKWGDQAYKQQATGEGEKFWEGKRLGVSFTECGVTVAQSPLKLRMAIQHGIYVGSTRKGRYQQPMWCPSPGYSSR